MEFSDIRVQSNQKGNIMPYAYNTAPNPGIAALMMTVATAFAWCARTVADLPTFILVLLWGFAALAFLVTLGALVSGSVQVDDAGIFTAKKMLAGFPFASIRLEPEAISAVELNRRMTPGLQRGNDTGSESPDKPRYRVDIVHAQGRFLVEASSRDLSAVAVQLAAALGCPMKRTGDWQS